MRSRISAAAGLPEPTKNVPAVIEVVGMTSKSNKFAVAVVCASPIRYLPKLSLVSRIDHQSAGCNTQKVGLISLAAVSCWIARPMISSRVQPANLFLELVSLVVGHSSLPLCAIPPFPNHRVGRVSTFAWVEPRPSA